MSNVPALQLSDPPDLLRRFVSSPNEFCIRSAGLHLRFRTNEPQLATTLGETVLECEGEGASINGTILFDSDLSVELSEAILLVTSDAVFLSFGRACLIAIARENREVSGFVAAELPNGAWSDLIVPALVAAIAELQ